MKKKFIVVTFDDGYIDNFTLAYPIIKKYKIPTTIYITTCFPDRRIKMWWYGLMQLLCENNYIDFFFKGKEYCYHTNNEKEKKETFWDLNVLFINETENLGILNKCLFEKYNIDLEIFAENETLSWDMVKQFSKDELITIGAHTVNHLNLKKLSDEKCKEEMQNSKLRLENILCKPVEHFAYPFGGFEEAGKREFTFARELGFKTATTTRTANIFYEHQNNLLSLPRININHHMNINDLKYHLDGYYHARNCKYKKIVID